MSQMLLFAESSAEAAAPLLDALAATVPRDQIVHCRTAGAALDCLFRRGSHAGRPPQERPDVVFLDLDPTFAKALALLHDIRANENTRLLPVVLLTATANQEQMCAAVAAGANSLVRKPAELSRYAATLTQIAGYWLDLNVPPPLPHVPQ